MPQSVLPDTVLVVEDSIIIALDTEEILTRIGIANVDVASSVNGAMDAIAKRQPNFAIVDFNLGAESSVPVTEELVRRGVPFVLATGYTGMEEKAEEIGAFAVLSKPYGQTEIEGLLNAFPDRQTMPPASESISTNESAGSPSPR